MDVTTLHDGGQRAEEIAELIADFLAGARRSLDIAQYDFHLAPATAAIVCPAIRGAHERGAAVRVLYNVDHGNPVPVPPPPEPDAVLISSLGVPAKAISGVPDLMHHKYALRDGRDLLTGSTNWTDDSWRRQENVLVRLESPELAAAYTFDFDELWSTGAVERSGFAQPRSIRVGGRDVRAWFTPGHGEALSARIAAAIAPAAACASALR